VDGPSGSLIYDWNDVGSARRPSDRSVTLDDETLRDGLQSPSATHPSHEEKLAFLELAAEIGITSADLGLSGAGKRAVCEIEALCREMRARGLAITPNCAARAREEDIRPALEIIQRLGAPLEIMLFLAFSPLRREIERWDLAELTFRLERLVRMATEGGAAVTFVAEDATRSRPDDLRSLCLAATGAGASRVCIADTAGHVTPLGAFRVVEHVRRLLAAAGLASVGLDWHGHNDRGMAVANALAAANAGADRLHGTALGVGERVGNAPMEQLVTNLRLLGWARPNLAPVVAYAEHAGRMLGVEVSPWTPIVGRDAFRTATGVHAAAILKAGYRGGDEIVDLVYSAVPASWFGRDQELVVGPMSGSSNVRAWLAAHGHEEESGLIAALVAGAKAADRTLSDRELERVVHVWRQSRQG
jgi:2-isopropylmalate synthase